MASQSENVDWSKEGAPTPHTSQLEQEHAEASLVL